MLQAAKGNRIACIQALIISPQGGPECTAMAAKQMQKRWRTFMCCLHKLRETDHVQIVPPDVLKLIYNLCAPPTNEFINWIPLKHIRFYTQMFDHEHKAQIADALTKRQYNQLQHALRTNTPCRKINTTPQKMAQSCNHHAAAVLLDPKALPPFREIMHENYTRLLTK